MKLIVIGWGPLGRMVGRAIEAREETQLVGVVDTDPNLAGGPAYAGAESAGRELIVAESLEKALAAGPADVAVLTTTSSLTSVAPQIEHIVSAGLPVVSSCEELSFPWRNAPELAARLDRQAREAGVAVVGAGINPGFLMDLWPLVLTSVCRRVDSIRVERIQDAAHRRKPFQVKIGAGLSLEGFEARRRSGTLRHVGLAESIHHVAHGLGWRLDDIDEVVQPVVAEQVRESAGVTVAAGQAAGVEQIGRGFIGGMEKIILIFRAAIGEPDPADTIVVEGDPPLRSTIPGGVPGDVSTVAVLLNTAAVIGDAPPGLRTMSELPVIGCRAGVPRTTYLS